MATENEVKDQELGVELIESVAHNKADVPHTAYVLQSTEKPPRKSALERKLLFKQDILIIPLLALCYFVTFLVSFLGLLPPP